MKEPTKAQIEKLWEGLGVNPHKEYEGLDWVWVYPNIDPNNLFKYAIPKLQSKGYQIDIVCFGQKGFDVAIFSTTRASYNPHSYQDDNLVLALFWAIYSLWEVIEGEVVNE